MGRAVYRAAFRISGQHNRRGQQEVSLTPRDYRVFDLSTPDQAGFPLRAMIDHLHGKVSVRIQDRDVTPARHEQ